MGRRVRYDIRDYKGFDSACEEDRKVSGLNWHKVAARRYALTVCHYQRAESASLGVGCILCESLRLITRPKCIPKHSGEI